VANLLADQPILTLFVVATTGALVGRIRVGGISLGVAAVVFAGLALSAAVPEAELPEEITVLGLAIFVYTVGLASGPTLRAALRAEGRRLVLLGVGLLLVTAAVAAAVAVLLGVGGAAAGGAYAGALTNAPTLATIVERLDGDAADRAVVAFAVTYPIGMIATLLVTARVLAAAGDTPDDGDAGLERITVRVEHDVGDVTGLLRSVDDVEVVRIDRDGRTVLAAPDTTIKRGDEVTLLGSPAGVRHVAEHAGGQRAPDAFDDRRALDFRPVLVTRHDVAGRTLEDLDLAGRHRARVTRVARGDIEWLARGDTTLELGDRVTLVAPPGRLDEVADELGDSVRGVGDVDVLTLGLGLAAGLALGLVSVPLGPVTLQLGFAGGPLIVGLVLGARVRTGPLLWQLPQPAANALRQFGLVLFLAGVGTRAGPAFVDALGSPDALTWATLGAVVVAIPLTGVLLLRDRFVAAIPDVDDEAVAVGALVAGAATQPAALALVEARGGSRSDQLGYATLFPLGMVGKVVLGQLLVVVL
jgi:putative transport protein